MNKLLLAKTLVDTARMMVQLKLHTLQRTMRRAVAKEIHVKQFEDVENDVTRALTPMFTAQTRSAAKNLNDMEEKGFKGVSDSAEVLTSLIFTPSDWDEELINRTLPVLAKGMVEAAITTLLTVGFDPRKGKKMEGTKASTATEWLEGRDDIDLGEFEFESPQGNIRIATEMPKWMQDGIKTELKDTFQQPYWKGINETTGVDISGFLKNELIAGRSIRDMAKGIEGKFKGQYSLARATTVARTESGNALNAGRNVAIEGLKEELGEAGQTVKKSWLSVLGNTTRDAHAGLDGVPEDEEGLFNLNGVRIPWPSHTSLPVGDRANCQCTLTTEFGLGDEEAQRLIAEGQARAELGEE